MMTGHPPPDMTAFRNSGLAHLLSVSGLHIAIVMGIGLVAVRTLLAAWPYAALHWPCKKIAVSLGSGVRRLLHGAHRLAGADGAQLRDGGSRRLRRCLSDDG